MILTVMSPIPVKPNHDEAISYHSFAFQVQVRVVTSLARKQFVARHRTSQILHHAAIYCRHVTPQRSLDECGDAFVCDETEVAEVFKALDADGAEWRQPQQQRGEPAFLATARPAAVLVQTRVHLEGTTNVDFGQVTLTTDLDYLFSITRIFLYIVILTFSRSASTSARFFSDFTSGK